MEQIERIQYYEGILDEANKAISDLSKAIEQYEIVREKIIELEAYYVSNTWRRDYEDDAVGKLPTDLKRGVLTEDAIYDLLTRYDVLNEEIKAMSEE